MQFISYLNKHDLLPAHQSGFRAGHSTETVLVRLLSDVFSAMDSGDVTLLALLEVSAAFDYVDHDILLETFRRSFGVLGTALSWLESFIRGRTQFVAISEVGDRDGVLFASECRKDRSWARSYTSFLPPKCHRLFDRPA